MTTSPYASDVLPDATADAAVIGGGAAGLNGELMLAPSRRSVVVIDSGTPRNAPAEATHGFTAQVGVSATAGAPWPAPTSTPCRPPLTPTRPSPQPGARQPPPDAPRHWPTARPPRHARDGRAPPTSTRRPDPLRR
ncbi:hypothetical protein GCM10027075_76810 [Streptomyces heilongjiangensis]